MSPAMSSELVKELRSIAEYHAGPLGKEVRAEWKAAARVEALEAALEPFARIAGLFDHMNDDGGSVMVNVRLSSLRSARRAREGGNADG